MFRLYRQAQNLETLSFKQLANSPRQFGGYFFLGVAVDNQAAKILAYSHQYVAVLVPKEPNSYGFIDH